MSHSIKAIALVIVALATSSLAEAQGVARVGRVTGLSITPTTVVGTNVDFDIELATTSPVGTTPASNAYGVGFIGNRYEVGLFNGYGTYSNIAVTVLDPELAAIRYNAGATGTATQSPVVADTLPLFATGAPNRFRGSFSTTYPAPGSYLLQTEAVNRANIGPTTLSTGTPVLLPVGSPVSVRLALTYTDYSVGNYTTTFTATFSNTVMLAARAQAALSLVGDDPVNPLEIPTVGRFGAALLALVLAAAAVITLRR